MLLPTFTVINTNDSGPGSLRLGLERARLQTDFIFAIEDQIGMAFSFQEVVRSSIRMP
jgi:hypothetical protein